VAQREGSEKAASTIVIDWAALQKLQKAKDKATQKENWVEDVAVGLSQASDELSQDDGFTINRMTGVIRRIEQMYSSEENLARLGYDIQDSFIDDSDVIVVEEEVDTKHGGFFINNGDIETNKRKRVDDDADGQPKQKRKKMGKIPIKSSKSKTKRLEKTKEKAKRTKGPPSKKNRTKTER